MFFRDAVHPRRARQTRCARSRFTASLALTSLDVPDEDWARRSQADLTAITVGRITVAPPWDRADRPTSRLSIPDPGCRIPITDHIVIVIDPSMGFGTGHHQTTRLVPGAAAVDRRSQDGRLIDVGTGSGVLAIAACDARRPVGHGDGQRSRRDPERAREHRAQRPSIVEIVQADLAAFTAAPADIVIANLTAAVLRHHASTLRRLVAPHGALIVSGFSPEELADVTAPFDAREVAPRRSRMGGGDAPRVNTLST